MPTPYDALPGKAFWRQAVAARAPQDIGELWQPKFAIRKDEAVATLGSCFAQHISKALRKAGYCWLNSEPAPKFFPEELKIDFQYDVFSARLGNVYTPALLRQWTEWAFGVREPPALVWNDGGRWFDPFRPNIQPNGFDSAEEVLSTRRQTLRALRNMFLQCRTLVFTLGLTETWVNVAENVVYPMCPGTVAGNFDPAVDRFKKHAFEEIHRDILWVLDFVAENNPGVKLLLTVSPVPLTATATDEHVLVATTYSKSLLRAVAGALSASRSDIDYFPSYEIISSFPFKAMFYQSNLRSVTPAGIEFVMTSFFRAMDGSALPVEPRPIKPVAEASPPDDDARDEVCEEMMLARAGNAGA